MNIVYIKVLKGGAETMEILHWLLENYGQFSIQFTICSFQNLAQNVRFCKVMPLKLSFTMLI